MFILHLKNHVAGNKFDEDTEVKKMKSLCGEGAGGGVL
jgi:hypothetical protein